MGHGQEGQAVQEVVLIGCAIQLQEKHHTVRACTTPNPPGPLPTTPSRHSQSGQEQPRSCWQDPSENPGATSSWLPRGGGGKIGGSLGKGLLPLSGTLAVPAGGSLEEEQRGPVMGGGRRTGAWKDHRPVQRHGGCWLQTSASPAGSLRSAKGPLGGGFCLSGRFRPLPVGADPPGWHSAKWGGLHAVMSHLRDVTGSPQRLGRGSAREGGH